MKIGIPRALAYYKYKDLWECFFKELGVEIILSPNSNRKILSEGIKHSIDESCLSAKLFVGHVAYLLDKTDYIFVPRIENFGKNDAVCVKFNALYDIINSTFNAKILDYNIDVTNGFTEKMGFMNVGKTLGFKKSETSYAYKKAKRHQINCAIERHLKQNALLKENALKLLLVGHPYNTHDNLIGLPIINILKHMDVCVIIASDCNSSLMNSYSKNLSKSLYWTFNKELLGAIEFYKSNIDGIILLSSFPCGPDSLVNDLLIRRIKDKPILNLVIDELNAQSGLITRLESFVDIVGFKKETAIL